MVELQDRAETRGESGAVADVEEPKTVADAVGDQAKLLLMTRFRRSLLVYVIAMICIPLPVCVS